jgi:hypothetical protein
MSGPAQPEVVAELCPRCGRDGPSPGNPRVKSKGLVLRLGCGVVAPPPILCRGGRADPHSLGRVFTVGLSGFRGGVALALVGSLALLSLALSTGGATRTPYDCSAPRGFVGAVAV